MRVLVVEDDDALRDSLGKSLKGDGWESEEVGSAQEAMEKVVKRPFDLVVSDYNLGPGEDGLSLLRYLREEGFSLPTILISGHGEGWLEVAAREWGVFAFFVKPFPLEPFLKSCRQARQEETRAQVNQQRRGEQCL